MPGGQGGAGGLAGMLMRGITGAGGPGGGIGGMGGMGRNGQNENGSATGSITDLYDVDRWKRADDLDSGFEPTMVQTVRDAWERDSEEKKQHSVVSRIRALLRRNRQGESVQKVTKRERRMERRARGARGRRDNYERERRYENTEIERDHENTRNKEQERPNRVRAFSYSERPHGTLEGNTIITPGMRKASHHIPEALPADIGVIEMGPGNLTNGSFPRRTYRNHMGLTTSAGIDSFFSASPLNSTLLAVDSLSVGPLTLNQVRREEIPVTAGRGFTPRTRATGSIFSENDPGISKVESESLRSPLHETLNSSVSTISVHDELAGEYSGSRPVASSDSFHSNKNLITDHTGTHYMDALREGREQRKYEVRVRNH